MEHLLPRRREQQVLVEQFEDEVLVYDLKRYRCYCLNQAAAAVWQACDGQRSPEDLAQVLLAEHAAVGCDPMLAREVVWGALEQLNRAALLEERLPRPLDSYRCTRRELRQRLQTVGALSLLLPTVLSIVVPSAASAASIRMVADALCVTNSDFYQGYCCAQAKRLCRKNKGCTGASCSMA